MVIKKLIFFFLVALCADYLSKFEFYLFYKYLKKDELMKNIKFSGDWYIKYSEELAYKRLKAETVEKSTEDDDISADEF